MSDITRTGIVLTFGPNAKREPGRVHEELHAPCGCAFHEHPAPHWHPCELHLIRLDGDGPRPFAEDDMLVPQEIYLAAMKVVRFFRENRLSGAICGLDYKFRDKP